MSFIIGTYLPKRSKEYQNQVEEAKISDEDFQALKQTFVFSRSKIAFQIFTFIIFLGPIRLVCFIFITIFTMSIIFSIRILMSILQTPNAGKKVCLSVARFGIRIILYCFGIFDIKTEGKFDENARFIISNHIGLLDLFVILIFHDIAIPIDQKWRNNSFAQMLLDCVDPIYVNYQKPNVVTKLICDASDDSARAPVLIFPEGIESRGCGDVLLNFDTTAFITPYKVQPTVIRYHMLCVAEGWNTVAYRGENLISYIWRLISMPPTTLHLHFLPSISMDIDGKSDINTFVTSTHLNMANYIGIQAIDKLEESKKKKKSK